MCLRLVAFHAHACRTDGHARRSATRDAILDIRVCAYGCQVHMVRVAHVVSRALIPHLTFQPDAGALVAPWAPSWTIVWQHVRGGEGEWRVRTCACALHVVPSQGEATTGIVSGAKLRMRVAIGSVLVPLLGTERGPRVGHLFWFPTCSRWFFTYQRTMGTDLGTHFEHTFCFPFWEHVFEFFAHLFVCFARFSGFNTRSIDADVRTHPQQLGSHNRLGSLRGAASASFRATSTPHGS